jgi:hypothetical protein
MLKIITKWLEEIVRGSIQSTPVAPKPGWAWLACYTLVHAQELRETRKALLDQFFFSYQNDMFHKMVLFNVSKLSSSI